MVKECREGEVFSPFPSPPVPNLRISPLGVVPKKAKEENRLIHHLFHAAALISFFRVVQVSELVAKSLNLEDICLLPWMVQITVRY